MKQIINIKFSICNRFVAIMLFGLLCNTAFSQMFERVTRPYVVMTNVTDYQYVIVGELEDGRKGIMTNEPITEDGNVYLKADTLTLVNDDYIENPPANCIWHANFWDGSAASDNNSLVFTDNDGNYLEMTETHCKVTTEGPSDSTTISEIIETQDMTPPEFTLPNMDIRWIAVQYSGSLGFTGTSFKTMSSGAGGIIKIYRLCPPPVLPEFNPLEPTEEIRCTSEGDLIYEFTQYGAERDPYNKIIVPYSGDDATIPVSNLLPNTVYDLYTKTQCRLSSSEEVVHRIHTQTMQQYCTVWVSKTSGANRPSWDNAYFDIKVDGILIDTVTKLDANDTAETIMVVPGLMSFGWHDGTRGHDDMGFTIMRDNDTIFSTLAGNLPPAVADVEGIYCNKCSLAKPHILARQLMCVGDEIKCATYVDNATYSWNLGGTTESIAIPDTAPDQDVLHVTCVINVEGCDPDSASADITIAHGPAASMLPTPERLCAGQDVSITVSADNDIITDVIWNDGSMSATHNFTNVQADFAPWAKAYTTRSLGEMPQQNPGLIILKNNKSVPFEYWREYADDNNLTIDDVMGVLCGDFGENSLVMSPIDTVMPWIQLATSVDEPGLANYLDTAVNNSIGKENTDSITAAHVDLTAAECAATWARSLGPEWYLPAAGEVSLLIDNMYYVRDAMQRLGNPLGNNISSLWTSTEQNADSAYIFDFGAGVVAASKDSANTVRAFRKIDLANIVPAHDTAIALAVCADTVRLPEIFHVYQQSTLQPFDTLLLQQELLYGNEIETIELRIDDVPDISQVNMSIDEATLPANVQAEYERGRLTIQGMPGEIGEFRFVVDYTGICGNIDTHGVIKVNPEATAKVKIITTDGVIEDFVPRISGVNIRCVKDNE